MTTRKPSRSAGSTPKPWALRLAWIAARAHLVANNQFEDFTEAQLGSRVSYQQAWGAARSVQAQSQWRKARGRPSATSQAVTNPAIWDSVVVDEPRLGLLPVFFRLPNDGVPRPGLTTFLGSVEGVRQVIELSSQREVLVIAVVTDLTEAEDLRAKIQDHVVGQAVQMDLVSYEDHSPARRTWIALAREALDLDRQGGP